MSPDESIRAIFKDNLNKLFEEKCTTQKALADFLGVSGTTISDWRKGKKMPRMDKLDRICSFFHVERDTLLSKYDIKIINKSKDDLPPEIEVFKTLARIQEILDTNSLRIEHHHITEAEQALLNAYRNAPADKKTIVNLTLGLNDGQ